MSRPRLLDLFCGAGGAAMGYHRAGFDVYGVDIKPQPNYPFDSCVEDAFRFLRWEWQREPFRAIHASPPCQAWTAYRRRGGGVGEGYANDLEPLRLALDETGLPWVIENVAGAPLIDPVMLCGTGLGLDVRRHRFFECSFPTLGVPCAHGLHGRRFAAATNRDKNSRKTVEIGVWRIPLTVQAKAMGIDRPMALHELSEAIPPAYTEHIGHYLMLEVQRRAREAA